MHACKWLSNSEELLKVLPAEDRAGKVDLDNGEQPSVKTLRILWVKEKTCSECIHLEMCTDV